MSFERFNKEKHVPLITSWYAGHGMGDSPDPELFSDVGFIVDGVLASFLYLTNSKIAYIDNTTGDPKADKEVRRNAWEELGELLINEAKERGYTVLCTTTYFNSMAAVLADYGFIMLPQAHNVYLKRL